jgi:hypothetical protein
MVSEEVEVMLDAVPEEIAVYDSSGARRYLSVEQRLLPNGKFLRASEDKEYGYEFAVHGELGCNQTELFQKLADKVKHGVSKRFTEVGELPNGQKYHSIIDDELVGRIDHDEMDSSVLMIAIYGQPYTWEQLGEMVKSYEGFQIQMKFFDMNDDVEYSINIGDFPPVR